MSSEWQMAGGSQNKKLFAGRMGENPSNKNLKDF